MPDQDSRARDAATESVPNQQSPRRPLAPEDSNSPSESSSSSSSSNESDAARDEAMARKMEGVVREALSPRARSRALEPAKSAALRRKIRDQLQQKLMRYITKAPRFARSTAAEKEAMIMALEDPAFFNKIDHSMRQLDHWDDNPDRGKWSAASRALEDRQREIAEAGKAPRFERPRFVNLQAEEAIRKIEEAALRHAARSRE